MEYTVKTGDLSKTITLDEVTYSVGDSSSSMMGGGNMNPSKDARMGDNQTKNGMDASGDFKMKDQMDASGDFRMGGGPDSSGDLGMGNMGAPMDMEEAGDEEDDDYTDTSYTPTMSDLGLLGACAGVLLLGIGVAFGYRRH